MEKEQWFELSASQKAEYLQPKLEELLKIKSGTHPLSGTREQGRICNIRKKLENEVFQTIDWEISE